jgi:CYTH domain-containing protein
MPIEIERKFLVAKDSWRGHAHGQRYCQGYLSKGDVTVRVRRAGPRAFLTIKGSGNEIVRPEFEYEIPVEEAEAMIKLCRRPLIEKTRYEVLHEGVVWEVDEFEGENAGLVLAEVELEHPDQLLALPEWVGAEVTSDQRYRNSQLVDAPMGEDREAGDLVGRLS